MAAQFDQKLLDSFRLDADSLRDVDAILRDRVAEIAPDIEVEYEVTRRDGLRYATSEVEDVLKERNGEEVAISRLIATAVQSDAIELNLDFNHSLSLKLRGEDRARIALLGSEVRSLSRDRLRTPPSPSKSQRVAVTVGVGFLVLLGCVGCLVFAYAFRERAYQSDVNSYEGTIAQLDEQPNADWSRRVDDAQASLASSDTDVIVRGLIEDRIATLEGIEQRADVEYPVYDRLPWYAFPLVVVVPTFALASSYFIMRFAWPATRSQFVFGDQALYEKRRQQRRERLIWSVGVAFVLGIASSLVVGWAA